MAGGDDLDLDLKNYNYDELLALFHIEASDTRTERMYKISQQLQLLKEHQSPAHLVTFYTKCKQVVCTLDELMENGYLTPHNRPQVLERMYELDVQEDLSLLRDTELYQHFVYTPLVGGEKEKSMNTPFYNTATLEYSLNGKNNTNTVFNVAVNEASPGDLNSVKRVTQLLNVNINSCFRSHYYQSSPCDFLYHLPVEIKNVLSLRLASIELPNSWYLFSSAKKNNTFIVGIQTTKKSTEYTIVIPDGNYTCDTLQEYLNTTYFCDSGVENDLQYLQFVIHPHSLKTQFKVVDTACVGLTFSLTFNTNVNQNVMNTAGWILGFRLANYFGATDLLSEGLFDAGGDRYIYVGITDFQYNSNTSNIVCFDQSILSEDVIAKIPMKNGKLSLILNDNNNPLAKLRRYNGPVNLAKLQIKLFDLFGDILDLNNMDFSMTLEVQVLYENFNFQNVTA